MERQTILNNSSTAISGQRQGQGKGLVQENNSEYK